MADFEVFISHDTRDYEVVKRLHDILWKTEMRPYIFELYPQYRRSIPEGIRCVMKNCSACLVVLTSFGIESPWVHQELGLAYGCERIIIPILEHGIEFKAKGFVELFGHIDYNPQNFDWLVCHVIYALRQEVFGHQERAGLALRCPNGHESREYLFPSTDEINKKIDASKPFIYGCTQCGVEIGVSPWTFEELQ